jgi:hydrophobic/amphiphilic exporter-1 (mainly G- bacteria), HAE1 family
MITRFIQRPVLSTVISLVITLLGVLAAFNLPVAQFPELAPPEVNVTAQYPGANAETLTRAVVRPLEQAINGVPDMKYMISTAGNDGTAIIQVRFAVGTDTEIAAVNVQNRVSTVLGTLPPEVRDYGLEVKKEVESILMYIDISSSDTTLTEEFLYNFAQINVHDELKRIEGVGFIDILGQREYAMRVWLKPDRLLAYNISAQEVLETLEEQNIEAAPGQIGESSGIAPQSMQYALLYPGRFTHEQEYENIVLRADPDGRILRLRDVADVTLSTAFFDVKAKKDGQPCAAILLKQLPGSNAQEVINRIKARMEELKRDVFLPGMEYNVSYDVSAFLEASMAVVIRTFIEVFLLVSLVVFIFLRDLRSTLIPAAAVPVSLVGAFFVMQFFGLSINLITLFALVLAIGIVVDNAIVVVEAVHVKMERNGLAPLPASEAAMKEIAGAIVAMTMVMSAVFIPVTFMGGPVGIVYRQFAVTMAIAIIISGVVALTLIPALCALVLRPPQKYEGKKTRNPIMRLLHAFERWYQGVEQKYRRFIERVVNRRSVTWGALLAFSIGSWGLTEIIPTGFLPNEDQGTVYATITMPQAATLERTEAVVDEVQRITGEIEAVRSVSSLAGQNILADGTGPIFGTLVIDMEHWRDRATSVDDLITELYRRTDHIKTAELEFFAPPPVPGYSAGGFSLYLQDRSGSGDQQAMQGVTDAFVEELRARPEIASVINLFDANFPQYMLYMDYDQAAKRGITTAAAFDNLQTLIGGEFATTFIRFGRMFRVMVQASPEYRAMPEDVLKLTVKNDAGEMVPYSNFMRMERVYGPEKIIRYNMYNAAPIVGDPADGYSTGDVIAAIREVSERNLPRGYGFEWSGITLDEVTSEGQGWLIFLISLVFVYLLLSAQYESFLLPFPVILFMPMGIFGAFTFVGMMGLENNLYVHVALLMLIGVLGKNAILIIEYANQRRQAGMSIIDAAVEAAGMRLRPILMTSFAFTAGLLPLMFSTGVGANGNSTIGSAGAGGMIFGTVFGVLVIPGLYYIFATLGERLGGKVESVATKAPDVAPPIPPHSPDADGSPEAAS